MRDGVGYRVENNQATAFVFHHRRGLYGEHCLSPNFCAAKMVELRSRPEMMENEWPFSPQYPTLSRRYEAPHPAARQPGRCYQAIP
jgi:hypothetical protein